MARPKAAAKQKLVDTHYRLPEPLYRKLRAKAYKQNRNQADIVVEALERHLNGGS